MNVVGVVRRIRDLGRLWGFPQGAFFLLPIGLGLGSVLVAVLASGAVMAPLAQAGEASGQPPMPGLVSSSPLPAPPLPARPVSSPQVIEITPADTQPTPVAADLPPSVGVDLNPVPLDRLHLDLPVRLPTGRRARIQVEVPPAR